MSTEHYFKKIKDVVSDKVGIDAHEIKMDSFIEDDLNIGELELHDILQELEEYYNVDLIEDRNEIETVQDLVDLLSEKID